MHHFTESAMRIMKTDEMDTKHKLAAITAMCGTKLSETTSILIMARGFIEDSDLDHDEKKELLEDFDEFIFEARQHEEKIVNAQRMICHKIGNYHAKEHHN